ncbi:MAG: hypothetical protein R2687_07235 [Candidatus Nanopelagicales bacterium]
MDVDASGTRKEELLMSTEELKIVWKLRRVLHALDTMQGIELLLSKLRETQNNYEFLRQVQQTTPARTSRRRFRTGWANSKGSARRVTDARVTRCRHIMSR